MLRLVLITEAATLYKSIYNWVNLKIFYLFYGKIKRRKTIVDLLCVWLHHDVAVDEDGADDGE